MDLSDRVLFKVVNGMILFNILSERVLFRVLSDKVLFRFLSVSVLFRILSDKLSFRILSGRSSLGSSVLYFWYAVIFLSKKPHKTDSEKHKEMYDKTLNITLKI